MLKNFRKKVISFILILTFSLTLISFSMLVFAAQEGMTLGNVVYEWNPTTPLAGWRPIAYWGGAVGAADTRNVNGVPTPVMFSYMQQGISIAPGTENTGNFVMDANIMFENGNNAGFVFRLADIATGTTPVGGDPGGHHAYFNTGYTLRFAPMQNTVRLYRTPGDNIVASVSMPILMNRAYAVRVVAFGNRIYVFIDDMIVPVMTYVDNNPGIRSSGEIAIFNSWSQVAFFDINVNEVLDFTLPEQPLSPVIWEFDGASSLNNWRSQAYFANYFPQLNMTGSSFYFPGTEAKTIFGANELNRETARDFQMEASVRMGPNDGWNRNYPLRRKGIFFRGTGVPAGAGIHPLHRVDNFNGYAVIIQAPNLQNVPVGQVAQGTIMLSAAAGADTYANFEPISSNAVRTIDFVSGNYHDIKIVCVANFIRVYWDGRLLFDVNIDNIENPNFRFTEAGEFGIFNRGIRTQFSQFRVTRVEVQPQVVVGIDGGSAVPSRLTAVTEFRGDGRIPEIIGYQWFRVNDSSVPFDGIGALPDGWRPISGATGRMYTTSAADLYRYLAVAVTTVYGDVFISDSVGPIVVSANEDFMNGGRHIWNISQHFPGIPAHERFGFVIGRDGRNTLESVQPNVSSATALLPYYFDAGTGFSIEYSYSLTQLQNNPQQTVGLMFGVRNIGDDYFPLPGRVAPRYFIENARMDGYVLAFNHLSSGTTITLQRVVNGIGRFEMYTWNGPAIGAGIEHNVRIDAVQEGYNLRITVYWSGNPSNGMNNELFSFVDTGWYSTPLGNLTHEDWIYISQQGWYRAALGYITHSDWRNLTTHGRIGFFQDYFSEPRFSSLSITPSTLIDSANFDPPIFYINYGTAEQARITNLNLIDGDEEITVVAAARVPNDGEASNAAMFLSMFNGDVFIGVQSVPRSLLPTGRFFEFRKTFTLNDLSANRIKAFVWDTDTMEYYGIAETLD